MTIPYCREESYLDSFDVILSRAKEALTEESFGLLCEIDVQAKLKEKTGTDIGPYVILGVCLPQLALQGLTVDPSIGVFLPCNLVVSSENNKTTVRAINPESIVQETGNLNLEPMAKEVKQKLESVLSRL